MRAFNKKKKPKHTTKVSILKDRIKISYMKKLSFVNNDYEFQHHELVSYWKHKTGWIMEATVFYYPKEYRRNMENINKHPYPKYSGVRTFYFDNYYTTKHMYFEVF